MPDRHRAQGVRAPIPNTLSYDTLEEAIALQRFYGD